jgi:hypothetical protein
MRALLAVLLGMLWVPVTTAQERPPIIDMHLHALAADSQGPPPLAMCTPIPLPTWDPSLPYEQIFLGMVKNPRCADPVWSPKTDDEVMTQTLDVMKRRNIFGVVSGPAERVETWVKAQSDRLIPAVWLPIGEKDALSPDAIRALHAKGRLAVLGEVLNQYAGIAPDDPRMEPYWALAEELDVPVGIHLGPGPPGVVYLGATGYRARLHSALTLEEVLVKHPRLRVYIMHAGFPMLDDLLAVLYAHPQGARRRGGHRLHPAAPRVLSVPSRHRGCRLREPRDVRIGPDGVAGRHRAGLGRHRRGPVPFPRAEARHSL